MTSDSERVEADLKQKLKDKEAELTAARSKVEKNEHICCCCAL